MRRQLPHQPRRTADRLLPSTVRDVDGNADEPDRTVSVFNGPPPEVLLFDTKDEEVAAVAASIGRARAEGVHPSEIALFVRTRDELGRARAAVETADLPWLELSERGQDAARQVLVGTMHLAKGLEFKAVGVIACDDGILPLQSRLEEVADETKLDDVYETERHLFYVACTRARDQLLITAVRLASEYIQDLGVALPT
jgi:superfamily I DNA/RNA helicase